MRMDIKLGVVVHTFNPSIQEAEAGGSQVQGQPGLHSGPSVKKTFKKLRRGKMR
jgi:hypothetical protein